MNERVVISSYPNTVVIGNRHWRPGINYLSDSDLDQVHWPSICRDPRLIEKRLDELEPTGCHRQSVQTQAC